MFSVFYQVAIWGYKIRSRSYDEKSKKTGNDDNLTYTAAIEQRYSVSGLFRTFVE